MGVIKEKDLPDHAGLIELILNSNGGYCSNYYTMRTTKKAPKLLGTAKITDQQKDSILSKYQFRYSQVKVKLLDQKIKEKESR